MTTFPGPPNGSRFERIADDLAERIRSGEITAGSPLPSVTDLAARYGVARGTVRHALEQLEDRHATVTRKGARWVVHEPARPHSFSVLRSFAQWATATGSRPSGRTVSIERGRANRTEATELGIRYRDPVLRCVRVRALDATPVMVERTTYLKRVAHIIEQLPAEVPSITRLLEREHGIVLAHAEHRISAVAATTADSELLGIGRGSPLLRVRRTGRAADGQAFEHSEDRYLPDAIELSVSNSAGHSSSRRRRDPV